MKFLTFLVNKTDRTSNAERYETAIFIQRETKLKFHTDLVQSFPIKKRKDLYEISYIFDEQNIA